MYGFAEKLVSTYSICVVDSGARLVGAAVASRYIAVGAVVPFLSARSGVILTQSVANPLFGPTGLDLLSSGVSPQATIDRLLADDPDRDIRQIAALRLDGAGATYSGSTCVPVVAEHREPGLLALGNTLASDSVPAAMAGAYRRAAEASRAAAAETRDPRARANSMAEALVAALHAGEEAGGDRRGRQAAAVVVKGPSLGYRGNGETAVDLRVDDHHDPISELDRIFGVFLANQREELPGDDVIEKRLNKEDV